MIRSRGSSSDVAHVQQGEMMMMPAFAYLADCSARGRRLPRVVAAMLACLGPMTAHAQAPATPLPAIGCSAAPAPASAVYFDRIMAMDRKLGLPEAYPVTHGLRVTPETRALVKAGHDVRGRSVRMAPRAAAALKQMIAAAKQDRVRLQLVSGFRTVAYQYRLVRGKLNRGMSIEAALRINTAPGYSEHHSGCAVDLTTPGTAPADESFARTRAYEWLQKHAAHFGFHLSYPRENANGIEFEPWHWRYVDDADVLPDTADSSDPGAAASSDGSDPGTG